MRLLGAAFDATFSRVALQFSKAAECGSQACVTVVDCASLLSAAFVAKLGASPSCTWSGDRRQLHVALGAGATAKLGDAVQTKAGTVAPQQLQASLRADGSPEITALLAALPRRVSSCGEILFSSAASRGGFGQAMQYSWAIVEPTPTEAADILRSTVEAAGAVGSFVIPAEKLREAYSAVSASGPWQLQVSLGLRNRFESAALTSAAVTVLQEDPTWQLLATTPSDLVVVPSQPARFAVQLVPPAACQGVPSAGTDQAPAISWQYRDRTGSGAWLPLPDSANFPGVTVSTSVNFPAFTFGPNKQYELQAKVGSQAVSFQLTVDPRKSPVLQMAGPAQVSPTCKFQLDAGATDPAHNPADGSPQLFYTWTCKGISTGASCPTPLAPSVSAASLQVPAGRIGAGTYEFEVSVENRQLLTSTTGKIAVEIVQGAPPHMAATVPWSEGEPLTAEAVGALRAEARFSECGGQQAPWFWVWALADASSGHAMQILSAPVSFPGGSPALPTPALLPGRRFAYALLGSQDFSALQRLSPPLGLAGGLPAGVFASVSASFTLERAPSGGVAQVAPVSGDPGTAFAVGTGDWQALDGSKLEYAIYRFDIPPGVTTSVENGVLVCSPACDLPELEWADRSSKNYWLTKGGTMLRSWGPSALVQGLSYPKGAHFTVIRARTSVAGASGLAYVRGPKVVAAPEHATLSTATELLSKAGADTESILDTVAHLSQLTYSAPEEKPATNLMLEKLEVAVDEKQVDLGRLQRFGQVLTTVLAHQEAARATDATLAKSASILGEVVTASNLASTDSLSLLDAGDSVLGSMQSIAAASLLTSGTGGGALAGQLSQTAASLADKVLSELRVGESTAFTSERVHPGASEIVKLTLAKENGASVAASGKSFFDGSVVVPQNALAGRRLLSPELRGGRQLQDGACSEVECRQVSWIGCNIYRSVASTFVLPLDASLKVVSLTQCSTVAQLSRMVQISLVVPKFPAAVTGAADPVCVRYDETNGTWSRQDVNISGGSLAAGGTATCESGWGSGTYAIAYQVDTRTTTTEVFVPGSLLPGGGDGANAASSVGLVVGVVFAVCCLSSCCLGLGMVYRRRQGRGKRQEEMEAALDIEQMEHEGVGEVPKGGSQTVKKPSFDDMDEYIESEDRGFDVLRDEELLVEPHRSSRVFLSPRRPSFCSRTSSVSSRCSREIAGQEMTGELSEAERRRRFAL